MSNPNEELHALELKISYLLRYGVLLAGLFLLGGWLVSLFTHGDQLAAFHVYHQESLQQHVANALGAHDYGTLVALAGLAFLVLLPVLRVLLTALLFVKQKDFILAGVAIFVFVILVASFTQGIDL